MDLVANQTMFSKVRLVARKKFDDLFSQGFARQVGALVGGTAFSQALMLLVLPLLTLLYTPDDFTVLAVFASILGIIGVAACLRLEIAIPLPQSDEDAANLLALALCSVACVAGMSALVIMLYTDEIISLIVQPKLQPYLWLLPLSIWFLGSYTALQYWATRKKRFSTIAKTRMMQAIGGAGTQVGFGLAGIVPLGLVLGQMINSGAGIVGLTRDALRNDSAALRAINRASLRKLFSEYDRFPKYSTFEALTNSASIQLPVIIIAALAVGPEAGFLMLANRVVNAPMALIGGAVSQVYLSRAPDELRAGTLGKFTANVIGKLVKTGVGPLVFVGIIAPIAFPFIFGEKWQRAGEMVSWMAPWFIMQFLASPVSMTLHINQCQRTALVLQILGFTLRIGAVAIAGYCAQTWVVESYAISGFVFYFLYLCIVVIISKISFRELFNAIESSAAVIAVWIILAILFRLAYWNLS